MANTEKNGHCCNGATIPLEDPLCGNLTCQAGCTYFNDLPSRLNPSLASTCARSLSPAAGQFSTACARPSTRRFSWSWHGPGYNEAARGGGFAQHLVADQSGNAE